MEKYIDPRYDVGFKLVFGREKVSEEVLMGFLNSLFEENPDFPKIMSLKYLNTEHPHEREEGKGIRYDLLCETSSGHRFIVEMQKTDNLHFFERSVYYVSRAIAEQGYRGKGEQETPWDYSLTPVIGVFLCDFDVRELEPKPVTHLRLTDTDNGKPVGDYMRYVFIQLPSFQNEEKDCNTLRDQWIYNIKNMGTNQAVAFTDKNPIFRKLAEIGRVATLNEKERRDYEAELRYERDRYAELKTAQIKGEEKGRAEGRAEGLAEGERSQALRTARKMLEGKMDVELISQMTDLSIPEILALQAQ